MTDWATAMRKGDNLRPIRHSDKDLCANAFSILLSRGQPAAPVEIRDATMARPALVILTD